MEGNTPGIHFLIIQQSFCGVCLPLVFSRDVDDAGKVCLADKRRSFVAENNYNFLLPKINSLNLGFTY